MIKCLISDHRKYIIKIFLKSYFENTAIEILDLYDIKEDDESNDYLLLSELNYFNCHLLRIAYNGGCKRFISTDTVQRVIYNIWTSSIIFSPDKILSFKKFTISKVILFCCFTKSLIIKVLIKIKHFKAYYQLCNAWACST